MSYLADSNILLRWIEPGTPMCEQAQEAVKILRTRGEDVFITPQNLVKFWNDATRPLQANGLGLTPSQAAAEAQHLEALSPLAPDTPAIHQEWRRLVVTTGVIGVQAHDARLVACMQVHGIIHLLTFNVKDFQRYSGITVVHPTEVHIDQNQQVNQDEAQT